MRQAVATTATLAAGEATGKAQQETSNSPSSSNSRRQAAAAAAAAEAAKAETVETTVTLRVEIAVEAVRGVQAVSRETATGEAAIKTASRELS
ncbi:hypothetical protein PoB_001187000 [Plakobranchus ocellatus]|uniref:Uncharacterized protein n=1 Tax=Plakobranchus ocellatus TaxID=259542 RepID=A0AAV3YRH6_9GAST|nr:hypothetical protein PoB_001187000 [Plakobranchus ocellatus]